MHDFHPGNRDDLLDDEEFDEVEEILDFLGEQSELNNLFGGQEQRILLMNYESSDEDNELGEATDSSMSGEPHD